jgi:hypothetical protein
LLEKEQAKPLSLRAAMSTAGFWWRFESPIIGAETSQAVRDD